MSRILMVVSFALLATTTYSQQIDEARMNVDLEIAEDILSKLMDQGGDFQWRLTSIKGSYVPGYGVIMNMPRDFGIREVQVVGQGSRILKGSAEEYVVISSTSKDKKDKDYTINLDSLRLGKKAKVKEAMTTFLADYADLIGQLNAEHKIMVTNKNNDSGLYFYGSRSNRGRSGNSSLTAEISKGDLTNYKQGKMNRNQLINKIVFTEEDESNEKVEDYELLSSIFNRLYQSDLSDSYYMSGGGLRYNVLPKFGVIFNMKVYSSNSSDRYFAMPTQRLEGLSESERNEKATELYPKFLKGLQKHMIEYGRTLKSLKSDEIMMFKVSLTKCEGCGIPKTVELSVKKSILDDFNSGKTSLDNAVAKIELKEIGKQ